MHRMLGLVAVLVLILTPLAADDLETRAEGLEERLMSPCCMANTVAVHESSASHRMRLEIRQMLGQSMSDREVLDHYVDQPPEDGAYAERLKRELEQF